ncbi:MAG: cryptochrome/photolyase family protein [Gammaproteobacteria bacterium]
MAAYKISLFIFRRDLRLEDNTGLNAALRFSDKVIAGFIFDPRQIEPHPYRSKPGFRFMLESIDDLKRQLTEAGGGLALYHAAPEEVVRQLFEQQRIEAVFMNRDYTPFSLRRDSEIARLCGRLGIALHVLPDALLTEPEQSLKRDRTPYKVFTAFYNRVRQFPVAVPKGLERPNFIKSENGFNPDRLGLFFDDGIAVMPGGRRQALILLDRVDRCKDYAVSRDFPCRNATSRLSAHLKFGTCSIREAYYAIVDRLGNDHPLLRQLYWRDFFTHIAFHFPHVFGHAFLEKFDHLEWNNNPAYYRAWCEGKTGFPVVDAGMRELNATGFMHNRVRMITASFLVKDLHIDWRWGERYFARHLVDYDPCVNNGNWQWTASTGSDAQPYFRIFNPWSQQLKFDPDCRYIYRWLPELNKIPADVIHRGDTMRIDGGYPAPIVDHAKECRLAKERYKNAAAQQKFSVNSWKG